MLGILKRILNKPDRPAPAERAPVASKEPDNPTVSFEDEAFRRLMSRRPTGPYGLERPESTSTEVYKRFIAKDPENERHGRGVVNPDGSAVIQWANASGFKRLPPSTEFATEAEWQPYFVKWAAEWFTPAEFGPLVEKEILEGKRDMNGNPIGPRGG